MIKFNWKFKSQIYFKKTKSIDIDRTYRQIKSNDSIDLRLFVIMERWKISQIEIYCEGEWC